MRRRAGAVSGRGGARATVAVDAKDRRNLARGDARHLLHLIRVHAHQPRHARLLPVGAHVVHGVTLLNGALVPVGAQHSHEPNRWAGVKSTTQSEWLALRDVHAVQAQGASGPSLPLPWASVVVAQLQVKRKGDV